MIVVFTESEFNNTPLATSYIDFDEYILYHGIELDPSVLFAWSENGATKTISYKSREDLERWLKEARKEAKEEMDNEKFERRVYE